MEIVFLNINYSWLIVQCGILFTASKVCGFSSIMKPSATPLLSHNHFHGLLSSCAPYSDKSNSAALNMIDSHQQTHKAKPQVANWPNNAACVCVAAALPAHFGGRQAGKFSRAVLMAGEKARARRLTPSTPSAPATQYSDLWLSGRDF